MRVRHRSIKRNEFGPGIRNALKSRDKDHKRAHLCLALDDQISADDKHQNGAQRVEEVAQEIEEILHLVDADPGTENLVRQDPCMLMIGVVLPVFDLSHVHDILPDRSLQYRSSARQSIDRTLKGRDEQGLRKIDNRVASAATSGWTQIKYPSVHRIVPP